MLVGTPLVYGAIHQFGGKIKAHTVKAKNGKCLHFMLGGKEVFAKEAHIPEITMPKRPFLMVQDEDNEDIAALVVKETFGVRWR